MPKKVNKVTGPANGRTDIAEGNGNDTELTGLIGTDEIAARAYDIYEREGRMDGRHLEHWFKAEEELRTERMGRPGGAPQAGSAASQPTSARSARQIGEKLPDTMAGAAATNG